MGQQKPIMNIRFAHLTDLDECVAIAAPNFNIFDREKRRKHFLEMIPKEQMLVLKMSSRILAYATFDSDWFGCTFLKLIVTDLAFRRQGLASKLIHHIEAHHCPSGKFFSSTEADNEPSIQMHKQHGFVESGWLDNLPQPHRELFYFKPT